MKISELTVHGFEAIVCPDPEREIGGVYIGDLLSWVMGRAREKQAWITIMSNLNVVAVASLIDLSAVIFAEGVRPDDDVIEVARSKGINLLLSPLPSYETALRLSELLK